MTTEDMPVTGGEMLEACGLSSQADAAMEAFDALDSLNVEISGRSIAVHRDVGISTIRKHFPSPPAPTAEAKDIESVVADAITKASVEDYPHVVAENVRLTARVEAAEKPLVDSATWPIVLAFARRMEAKLDRNRHKGDAEGWRQDPAKALYKRLQEESVELRRAMDLKGDDVPMKGYAENVADEAADVANFAMMIADIAAIGGGS